MGALDIWRQRGRPYGIHAILVLLLVVRSGRRRRALACESGFDNSGSRRVRGNRRRVGRLFSSFSVCPSDRAPADSFFPLFFELPAVLFIGFWALSQLFSGTLSLAYQGNIGGVAWWGHVGGFAAGILLQFFFVKRGNGYRLPSRDEYHIESAWVPTNYWRHNL